MLLPAAVLAATVGCAWLQKTVDDLAPLAKQYGPAVLDAAKALCAAEHAKRTGVDWKKVKDTTCSTLEHVEPFIGEAARAGKVGATRAGLAPYGR